MECMDVSESRVCFPDEFVRIDDDDAEAMEDVRILDRQCDILLSLSCTLSE
jgi:hypothetical protein